MSEMSLEKTYALLEKLAEYVMTQVATKQEVNDLRHEMNEKFETKADKIDVDRLGQKVNQLDNKVNLILEGMDAQAKRLETLTIENMSTSRTLNIHEDRLGELEEHVFGARVREDDEKYKNKDAAEK